MFTIVRSVRVQAPISPLSPPYSHKIISKTSKIRFAQAAAGPSDESDKMDKQNEEHKTEKGDVLGHSFGDAYATRSEEEGFGGTYAPTQSLTKEDEDEEAVHENQGSEVKEKEQGRNQIKPAS